MPGGSALRVGRYELHEAIATGGMATVHLGRLLGPVGFSRTVAIKRLHPQFASDPEFLAMFVDEARLAAQVRHPNVVPTVDVVAADGQLFVVMEYVQGATLASLLAARRAQRERLPVPVVLSIVAGALHGLHAAHEARSDSGQVLSIVHRDVSPQNLMVGVDGVTRVLDFGVAKAASRTQATADGQVKGKLAYMAPEQLLSQPVDRRVDIYAASVVLWEALTGHRLFTSDSSGGLVHAVLSHDVPLPSAFVSGLDEAVEAVVMRGLSRDRQARFSTAREMALAIERTGDLATALEVGAWVERLASSELSRQGDACERVASACTDAGGAFSPRAEAPLVEVVGAPSSRESAAGSGVETVTLPRASRPEPRTGARRVALLVGALAAAVIALVFAGSRWSRQVAPEPVISATSPPEAEHAQPITVSAPEPVVEPVPTELPTATASASASAPVAVRTPSKQVPSPRPRPPASPSKKPSCNPAFEFDAEGNKRYKPGCLDK